MGLVALAGWWSEINVGFVKDIDEKRSLNDDGEKQLFVPRWK